jgi:hypothetical protein
VSQCKPHVSLNVILRDSKALQNDHRSTSNQTEASRALGQAIASGWNDKMENQAEAEVAEVSGN